MVLLSSLNSCCNPWIYLAFSGNLLLHLLPCLRPCCAPAPDPRLRRALFLRTPSPSRHRGIELLGFTARNPRGGPRGHPAPDATAASTAATLRQLRGLRDGTGTLEQKPGTPPRQGSLTSLLTTRVSRPTVTGTGTRPQTGVTSPVGASPKAHRRDAATLTTTAERKGKPRSGSPLAQSGGGHVLRKMVAPPDLIIPALGEDAAAQQTGSGQESSSSSSNPRSPHFFKRTRLRERPAREVAEAQLKWEHNMGIKGGSSSACYT